MPGLTVITRNDLLIIGGIILLSALLIGGGMVGAAYLYVSRQVAAHEQLATDTKKQVEETKQSDQQADSKLRETKHTIARTSDRVKTPQDVVASLPLIHSRFANSVQVLPPATPDAPSQLIVVDPKAFFDAAAECAGSKAELDTCSVKLDNANKRVGLESKRADDAERIMKGGGFWSKLKSNAKWFLFGGMAGAAGAYAATR